MTQYFYWLSTSNLQFPSRKSPCTNKGLILLPSLVSGSNTCGMTSSTSRLKAVSYSGRRPFERRSLAKKWLMSLVKYRVQLSSHLTGCSVFLCTVVVWNPNLPVGETPLRCNSATLAQNFAGSGISVDISMKSQRKKYVSGEANLSFPQPSGF